MPRSPTVIWTREHELIALNLYGKLPFGQFDQQNTVIREVASKMGRSPGSLAMKLGNLASLDPVQRARGIKGLSGASTLDREMWNEFHANVGNRGPESEQLLHDLFTQDSSNEIDFLEPGKVRVKPSLRPSSGPTETKALVRVRRGQQFFRQTILNMYDVRCCISGIDVPRLLVASHIIPWSREPGLRLSPRNGLCLSSLHDAAFDDGLITLDKDYAVVLSPQLKRYLPSSALEQNFERFEGQPIEFPNKLAEPDPGFIAYHRENIFRG